MERGRPGGGGNIILYKIHTPGWWLMVMSPGDPAEPEANRGHVH